MDGINLILIERKEQVTKHGRTIEGDVLENNENQLSLAASWLVIPDTIGCLDREDIIEDHCPIDWDKSNWERMVNKTYKERLIIAGALIAAEIDRIQALEE